MTVRTILPRRLATGDAAQDARDRQRDADLRAPLSCPLLAGVLVSGKVPDVGNLTVIRHNLGRMPKGWVLVDILDDGVDVYRTTWDETTLTLDRGASAAVDSRFTLWVF